MTQGSYKQPTIGAMTDIESLALGPNAVVTQIAFVFFPIADPETVLAETVVHLPIEPQLTLKREISAQTLIWWMGQSDSARKEFERNEGEDFEELPSLLRHVNRKFDEVTDGQEYELFSRGPQFDIVNIESLMTSCGLKPAWRYDRVRDLRTLMALAGLRTGDVPRDTTRYPEHQALADCHYQILCYAESIRALRSRS
jgi:exodeoxyribonuclease VIII